MKRPITVTEFRKDLDAVLDRVHDRHERFIIERNGVAVAAVVPVETLESMEALSRDFMLAVLNRRKGRGPANSMALANEAKHRSRPR